MRLLLLHEDRLSPEQLAAIVADIKPMLKEVLFGPAIWRQMRRHGYGRDGRIFKQIGAEMRRRSAVKRTVNRPQNRESHKQRVEQAVALAKKLHYDALTMSSDLDIDISGAILSAAEKFGLTYNDVSSAM